MVAAITVSAVLFSGDNSARAEFFDAVDDLETLSIDALADGVLTSEEAATLNAQAAMVEQVLESDVDAVANSSADEHSNALDALGEVRERLAERAVGDEEAGPTANAVIVLERVSAKLADPTHGAGRPDEPGRSGERGRGEGNSGQGQGNAPQGTESNANLGGDSNSAPAEDDTDANPGRGRGRS